MSTGPDPTRSARPMPRRRRWTCCSPMGSPACCGGWTRADPACAWGCWSLRGLVF